MASKLFWTHTTLRIKDIIQVQNIYLISFTVSPYSEGTNLNLKESDIISISKNIFDSKLLSYFMVDRNFISRSDILNLSFNAHITYGYRLEDQTPSAIEGIKRIYSKTNGVSNKFYLNFIDINSPLVKEKSFLNNIIIADSDTELESLLIGMYGTTKS